MRAITKNLKIIVNAYGKIIEGIEKEDNKKLKKIKKELDATTAKTKYLKDHINIIVDKLREGSEDNAYYFVQVLDFMREMLHSISFIAGPVYEHVDNNHKPLIADQVAELKQLDSVFNVMVSMIVNDIETCNYDSQDDIQQELNKLLELIELSNKKQIKRIKNSVVGTKNSILFMNIINESKNLSLQAVNLYKSQRDFVDYKNGE